MRVRSKGGGGSAAGRMLLVAGVAVTVPLSAALFGACGGDERAHVPLPDGGVGANTSSSSSSSSSASSGAEGGQGGASSSSAGGGGTGGVNPLCANGVKDGTESDVDCGGGDECPPCADGKICTGASDCVSLSCELGLCSPAACDDLVQNGDETDVDCGGGCGPTCVLGKGCTMGTDCVSSSCVGAKCAPPTCVDGVKNGAETGKDCGGPNCPNCPAGEPCATNDDCQSLVCDSGTLICQQPTCTDGVKNGTESDTDCGGNSCSTKCAIGKSCVGAANCVGGSAANCVASKCACPPGMVIIPILGEGTYCIDQTEVSYNEYLSFLQANPTGPAFKPAPQCDGNANYTPPAGWPPAQADLPRPVASVDWCDAFAYCTYVGKRLCGHIGGGAGVFADFANPTESEWHNACTANGQNVYPYGDAYSINACQGEGDVTSVSVKTAPGNSVIESPTCIGGTSPFLFHMSGNVSEWEDSCQSTAANALCHVRGGAFGGDSTTLACAADATASRTSSSPDRGFRCCL